MDNTVEKNRKLLEDAIKRIGKSRLPFEEKDIQQLAESKSFDFVDYLKKTIVLNRYLDEDDKLNLETEFANEYNENLKEIAKLENNNEDLSKNKRYNRLKNKTDHGLSFFMLQSYFDPKTLNKVAKNNEDIEYAVDMAIDRSARKSLHWKEDRERAISNATVNVFRKEFPKAQTLGINRNTLCLDTEGQTGSKIAAKSIGMMCEKGVFSSLISKMTNRIDNFNKSFNVPESLSNSKIFKGAKNVFAIAASAAVVAFLGHEALEVMSTPMPPIADLNVKEAIEVFASVDIPETAKNVVDLTKDIAPDMLNVQGVDIDSLQGTQEIAAVAKEVQENSDISDFIMEKENLRVTLESGQTIIEVAKQQLGDNANHNEVMNLVAAISDYNDLDTPNMVLEGANIEIPPVEFLNEYENNLFEITAINKKEILEQMKNIEIGAGETQSELIEKLSVAMKDNNILNASQLSDFKESLKEVIPVDLKAYDTEVGEKIKTLVEGVEKLQNKSQFKPR